MSNINPNSYYIYQGKLNNRAIGRQPGIVTARGPMSAIKLLFPEMNIRKATQKEIFGSQGNQFGMQNGSMQYKGQPHKQPANWIQLNHCNKDESYFFILG